MAVFIVYGNRYEDEEEQDREMEYVGIDAKKAFETPLGNNHSLHMEIWVDNTIYETQAKKGANKDWVTEYSAVKQLEKLIEESKKTLSKQQQKLDKMKESAHSEGIYV